MAISNTFFKKKQQQLVSPLLFYLKRITVKYSGSPPFPLSSSSSSSVRIVKIAAYCINKIFSKYFVILKNISKRNEKSGWDSRLRIVKHFRDCYDYYYYSVEMLSVLTDDVNLKLENKDMHQVDLCWETKRIMWQVYDKSKVFSVSVVHNLNFNLEHCILLKYFHLFVFDLIIVCVLMWDRIMMLMWIVL